MLIDSAARWARDVREQEVATVDPKKAAAVLGLDAKNAPAVAEALRGDESTVRKKLEALGRKLEHRLSGKDMFDRLARTTGLAVRPHLLRHTAATTWLAQGTARDTVQHLLGHVSPVSMGPYLHPDEADKRAAVERAAAWAKGQQ